MASTLVFDHLAYLDQLPNYEQQMPSVSDGAFGLDRMRRLLGGLGAPERQWPSLHVAGTKGKGSTCALLAAILRAAGYRVGLYTSPHLIDPRERIQLNGRWVEEAELTEAVAAVREAATQLGETPTYFEAYTAAAFWLFARWSVEIAVVEVGLGGRLDATNVLDPLVTVITPISLDHTDVLGTTVTAIAREKTGIMKTGRPVVVAPQTDGVLSELRTVATARRAPWVEVQEAARVETVAVSVEGQRVTIQTPRRTYPGITLPLLGAHQRVNLATALLALEALPDSWIISSGAVAAGVAAVQWPGRLQIVTRRPWVILDGAQNAASAAALAEAVRTLWPGHPVHLILGISSNKDVEGVAQALVSLVASVTATQSGHPRALPVRELAARLSPWYPAVSTAETVTEAVARLRQSCTEEACIVVTGSFYLLGELLSAVPISHG